MVPFSGAGGRRLPAARRRVRGMDNRRSPERVAQARVVEIRVPLPEECPPGSLRAVGWNSRDSGVRMPRPMRYATLPSIVRCFVTLALCAATPMPAALAQDNRDVVFECPCHAEWVPGDSDGPGELTLTFGMRNLRASASGEVRLLYSTSRGVSGLSGWPPAGRIPAGTVLTGLGQTVPFRRPESEQPISIRLYEQIAEVPSGVEDEDKPGWHRSEELVLWPIPGDPSSGRTVRDTHESRLTRSVGQDAHCRAPTGFVTGRWLV